MENVNWLGAMEQRKSVRSYESKPVEDVVMTKLRDFAEHLQVPFTHNVQVRFFKTDPGRRLYSAMRTAPPDAMAFITPTGILSDSAEGFIGQMMVLYATSLGLSSCWFGSYSREELRPLLPDLTEENNTVLLCALGYFKKEGLRLYDRAAGILMSGNRKPLSVLLESGQNVNDLPSWLQEALGWARKSPSAINSQPWRFTVSQDFKTVHIAKPIGYQHPAWKHPDLDVGICACQFYLALLSQGTTFTLSLMQDRSRAVWEFKL